MAYGRSIVIASLVVLSQGVSVRSARALPVGTIFSGPATADPAATYWNPAAMTLMKGTHTMIFGNLSAIGVTYQRSTVSAFDGQPFPEASFSVFTPRGTFGLVTDFGLRDWRFGVGLALPWADGADWKTTYGGRPASTRDHGLGPRTGQLFAGPVVAYRVNRYLSVGVGVELVGLLVHHEFMLDYGAKVNQISCLALEATNCPLDAPFAREDPANDGQVTIDGIGFDVGFQVGLLFTPFPWLRIGVGFHSNGVGVGSKSGGMKVPATLDVEVPDAVKDFVEQSPFLTGVAVSTLKAEGDIEMGVPMIVNAGVVAGPFGRVEVAADFSWMQTSATERILGFIRQSNTALITDIDLFKTRKDKYGFGVRGSYDILPNLAIGLRFEFSSDARPEEFVTPTSVDTDKYSLELGVAWRIADWLLMYGEYAHFFLPERNIRQSRFVPNSNPQTPEEQGFDKTSPAGLYTIAGDRAGVGFLLSF